MLKLDFFCSNRLCLADPLLERQQSSFGSTGTSSSMKGLTSSEKTSRVRSTESMAKLDMGHEDFLTSQ